MPLYTYKCTKCEYIIEKFIHLSDENVEILCGECGNKCERQISICKNRTEIDAKTIYNEKIIPETKKIMDGMHDGNDSDFFDIYGDE